MQATCTTCAKEIPAEASEHFAGVCPWCLAAFVKPAAETPSPIRRMIGEAPLRRGTPVRALAPDTPAELASIVERCLAHDPAKRYADMGEMVADLRRFRRGMAVEAHSKSFAYRAWRWITRRQLAVGIAASVLVVAGFAWRTEVRRRAAVQEHQALVDLGAGLLEKQEDRHAREVLTKAIGIEPTVKAYLLRGLASWRLLDFDAAAADATAAIALEPDPREIYRFRSDVRHALHDEAGAAADLAIARR